MNTLWKYLQYGYLVVAIIFLVEGIVRINSNLPQALVMFGLSLFIAFIFIFKRRFRKKIQERDKQK